MYVYRYCMTYTNKLSSFKPEISTIPLLLNSVNANFENKTLYKIRTTKKVKAMKPFTMKILGLPIEI